MASSQKHPPRRARPARRPQSSVQQQVAQAFEAFREHQHPDVVRALAELRRTVEQSPTISVQNIPQ